MFVNLFQRAEATVDNAIGDLGNRVIVAIPFLMALGFACASLALALYRNYGAEAGNLIVAGACVILGSVIALVVRLRSRPAGQSASDSAPQDGPETAATQSSVFDDETLMAVVSAAAPIIIPAVLRTGMKNWPLLLAAAAGLYVFSQSSAETKFPSRSI